MSVRIIGCGNIDRGDDGAGVLAARRLRELGIEAQEQGGEALSLIESWRGAGCVILIDAVVTGVPAGNISLWDADTAPVQGDSFRRSTHAFGVGEAIQLARALNRLPQRLRIYGIEGRQFEPGAGPSPQVTAAVEAVVQQILVEVARP